MSILTDQSADKLIELNKTYMDAILKAFSIVMNENRRTKELTMIKQLKMQEYSINTSNQIIIFMCYSLQRLLRV